MSHHSSLFFRSSASSCEGSQRHPGNADDTDTTATKNTKKKTKVIDHGHGGVAHTRSRKPDSIPLPHVSSPLGWLMPADRLCGLHTALLSKYLSMGESSWLTCRYRGIAERAHRTKNFPQQSPTLRQSSQATHGQRHEPSSVPCHQFSNFGISFSFFDPFPVHGKRAQALVYSSPQRTLLRRRMRKLSCKKLALSTFSEYTSGRRFPSMNSKLLC